MAGEIDAPSWVEISAAPPWAEIDVPQLHHLVRRMVLKMSTGWILKWPRLALHGFNRGERREERGPEKMGEKRRKKGGREKADRGNKKRKRKKKSLKNGAS